MAGFVQIIEFKTSRIKEIEELGRPSRTEGALRPPSAALLPRRTGTTQGPTSPSSTSNPLSRRWRTPAGRKRRSSLPKWRNCATDP
jgi:hypothetical protein